MSTIDLPPLPSTIQIDQYHDRPDRFWVLMGPFLGTRHYRRAMPYLIDDDGYVWLIAMDTTRDVVAGFASLHIDTRKRGHLHGLYVVPDYRQQSLAHHLIAQRLAYVREHGVVHVQTTANATSRELLASYGFREVKEQGQYTVMEAIL